MVVPQTACDVLVVGSGAGGLTAALVAREGGLDVRVVEKTRSIGGTTALSEGMVWIPANRRAAAAGLVDSNEAALDYLSGVAGEFFDEPRARRFVESAAEMLEFVEVHSWVRFTLARGSVDYDSSRSGATRGARSFDPDPFDGRRLGADFTRLRFPLATTMIFGGLSVTGVDLPHFLKVFASTRSARYVAGRLAGHVRDRIMGLPRGSFLGGGNALVARLFLSLKEKGVAVWTETPATRLLTEGRAVVGAAVERGGRPEEIRARLGVILACGGFPASDEMRREHYPHVRAGKNHVRLAPPGNTGDGLRLAEAVGGALETRLAQPAAWAPVSLVPQGDGTTVPFPHFIDRNKPGFVIVDRRGRRFVNESDSYHRIVQAMIAASSGDPVIEAFVIGDHAAIRRYSIGVVPPAPGRTGPHLRSGYLVKAGTPAELGRRLGIDGDALADTIARFNDQARRGADPDFGRGLSAYNRANGDPAQRPNPALGPLDRPPFYAVRIVPGDLGTFLGLRGDPDARVVDGAGHPIPGLYAAGNDLASVMGGNYPAAGITIGSAMTFAYVAARHIRSRAVS